MYEKFLNKKGPLRTFIVAREGLEPSTRAYETLKLPITPPHSANIEIK